MRRAFTLIELLVVIAVIGLIMGILLPALAQSRKTAKGAVGFANLRTLSQMMAVYLHDAQEDFPNPFRKEWPDTPRYAGMEWTTICSESDTSRRWDFCSPACPPASTEGFATVWYSFLSEHRGGHRLDAEQVSPADGELVTQLKEARQDPMAVDGATLLPTSFYYSPTFWSRTERYSGACRTEMTPQMLRTAHLGAVRHPTAKVMLWERADFVRAREPIAYNDPRAHTRVATVDGSCDTVVMADLIERAEREDDLVPRHTCCGPPPPLLPYFWATRNGVAGRDLAR